jgi:tetratricopeptide (TPR) repeat protein
MSAVEPDLERARAAYAERSWREAYEAFARADEADPLAPDDLELRATTARMLVRDDEAVELLERAHHAYLERGEPLPAALCAGWIGMTLFYNGAVGPAGGWLARAHRLLEDAPQETAVHGYVLLPEVFRHEATGDREAAVEAAARAAQIGKRHGDPELMALAIHAHGHMLVLSGRVPEGLVLLDEAMVTATTAELSPFVVGIVYCGVILACQEGFEVARAREWTRELTRWVAEQRDLVAFTGRCRVHRAEILQLEGSWSEAFEEARLAVERLAESRNPAAGSRSTGRVSSCGCGASSRLPRRRIAAPARTAGSRSRAWRSFGSPRGGATRRSQPSAGRARRSPSRSSGRRSFPPGSRSASP